jgi:aspartyl-tRNA(Asn)/glutamyl-tRNA(Gln) amidotransferase subunit B
VLGEISRWRSELGDGFKAAPQLVVPLMIAIKAGVLTNVQAKTIFEKIAREGVDPTKLIVESVSASKASTADLDAIIAEVISANPAPVTDYRKGKKAAVMALVGQVMKRTRGAADALLVRSLVEAKLESMEEN